MQKKEAPYNYILRRVTVECLRARETNSKGVLTAFRVRDYVIVAWPREMTNLVGIWTGGMACNRVGRTSVYRGGCSSGRGTGSTRGEDFSWFRRILTHSGKAWEGQYSDA